MSGPKNAWKLYLKELNYSLPAGIPVVDEQGDVFLLSKDLLETQR